jgi:hypothetical protein
MANITITENNLNTPIHDSAEFRDDVITFAGADVLSPGTLLARDSVSLKLVIFVKGGTTNGNGIPKAILTYPVTATGAGDIPVRVAVAGRYRKDNLVIDADGDSSNIDNEVIDQLRDYGLIPIDVDELNIADNS